MYVKVEGPSPRHQQIRARHLEVVGFALFIAFAPGVAGCRSPGAHRGDADRVAYDIIGETQRDVLGKTEPFTIETPADTLRRRLMLDKDLPHVGPESLGAADVEPISNWPEDDYLAKSDTSDALGSLQPTEGVMRFSLEQALQIAARSSREYQAQKEQVFRAALQLDLRRDDFRYTWQGAIDSLFNADLGRDVVIDTRGNTDQRTISGLENTASLDLSRRFKGGLAFTAMVGVDLVKLLTQDRITSRGVYGDASISIPLLRGSGRFVVTEPLTQAQRDMVYAIYGFERYKRTFAVRIASDYLSVLQQLDQVENSRENYRSLIASTRRAVRLAEAGRLPEIQVDQAKQNELRARDRWVASREGYRRRLDGFKISLGLPPDAPIELDRSELERLTETSDGPSPVTVRPDEGQAQAADAPIILVEPDRQGAGPLEMEERAAILLALERRLDLRVEIGRVHDSQRGVVIAADQLRADLTLLGSGSVGSGRSLGSAASDDANMRTEEGSYSALLNLDLALERTAERNAYRSSLIDLERAVRDVQALEDEIKLDIRNGLSDLLESRESIRIQVESVAVAERRVESTNLFLEAGRAEIRDLLEAQEALVSAQNALTAALVGYRVGELELQRDLGVLDVNERGLWQEYVP